MGVAFIITSLCSLEYKEHAWGIVKWDCTRQKDTIHIHMLAFATWDTQEGYIHRNAKIFILRPNVQACWMVKTVEWVKE